MFNHCSTTFNYIMIDKSLNLKMMILIWKIARKFDSMVSSKLQENVNNIILMYYHPTYQTIAPLIRPLSHLLDHCPTYQTIVPLIRPLSHLLEHCPIRHCPTVSVVYKPILTLSSSPPGRKIKEVALQHDLGVDLRTAAFVLALTKISNNIIMAGFTFT